MPMQQRAEPVVAGPAGRNLADPTIATVENAAVGVVTTKVLDATALKGR